MATPYDARLAAGLQGGVAGSVLGQDFTGDCAAAMTVGMASENHCRQLASQAPGLGALLPLPQLPSGAGVGIADLDPAAPVVGEGYGVQAEIAAAVHKAYGPDRPSYADPFLGGPGYADGIHQPARRHVSNLGADGLLIEPGPDGRQPAPGPVVISPATGRRSLLGRLVDRLRGR